MPANKTLNEEILAPFIRLGAQRIDDYRVQTNEGTVYRAASGRVNVTMKDSWKTTIVFPHPDTGRLYGIRQGDFLDIDFGNGPVRTQRSWLSTGEYNGKITKKILDIAQPIKLL